MTFARCKLLAATSAIALLAAGPALARNMDLVGAGPTGGDLNINMEMSASETGAYTQLPNQIRAERLVGRQLINAQGKSIGDTESVIIDRDGKVAALIVGIGGYLGIGEHRVAIAWKDIRVLNGGRSLRTNLSKAELQALPEYRHKQTARLGGWSKNRSYPKGGNDKDLRTVGGARY